jgi:hypothetical protein
VSLHVPAADPASASDAASKGDSLVGSLSPSSSTLSTLVQSGWRGEAATAAAAEGGTLGRLLTEFTDKVNRAAGVMRTFASTYGELRTTMQTLSTSHTDATTRRDSLDGEIERLETFVGPRTEAQEQRLHQLRTQRDEAQAEIDRCVREHGTAMTDFRTAQQQAAGQLDAVVPAGLSGSFSQQSAQIQALVFNQLPTVRYEEGKELAEQIRTSLREDGGPTQEQMDQLEAYADNPDFVRGLYEGLGPEGVAALSWVARNAYGSSDEETVREAEELRAALATTFTHASNQGLIDEAWLDNFDPKDAFDSGSCYYNDPVDHGFRADLLIPLVQDGALPTNVLSMIGDRAMADLQNGMDGGGPMVYDKWGAYESGNPDNPYERNLMRQFLGTLSQDPEASNSVLMGNFETMQAIGRGGLGVDELEENIGPALSTVLHEGTIGMADLDGDGVVDGDTNGDGRVDDRSQSKLFLGDALFARIVLDTADHPDDHYEDFYRNELGALVTNSRYFDDAMYSVTTMAQGGMPNSYDEWIDSDSRFYRDGLEIDKSAWAAIHEEVMADPATATKIIALTDRAMDQATNQLNSGVPPGGGGADPSLNYSSAIARNQMHQFMIGNLDGASERLQGELEQIAEDRDQAKENASGAVSQIFEWASNPAEMPQSIAGLAVDKIADVTIGGLIDASYADEERDTEAALNGLRETREELRADELNGAVETYRDSADALVVSPGRIQPVTVLDANGQPVTYNGDPQQYIDQYSGTEYSPGAGQPIQRDANFIDPATRQPYPVEQMNSYQLQAYEAWLADPAVQAQTRRSVEAIFGTQGG